MMKGAYPYSQDNPLTKDQGEVEKLEQEDESRQVGHGAMRLPLHLMVL